MPEIEVEDGASSEPPELQPEAAFFGKYEIGKLLGRGPRGAFAKVYHGRNVRTGQSVATKAVCKQKIVKGGLMGNMKKEIAIMLRLRHPHVLKLFEVLTTKTKIYFVMELAKGGELFARITQGRFSEDLSSRYRDLKPENVPLDENWI